MNIFFTPLRSFFGGKRENDTGVIFDVFSTAGTRLCRAEWRWQSPGSKVDPSRVRGGSPAKALRKAKKKSLIEALF